ncbi:uncharacterized protein LOC126876895 [Bombus huntii]|uniref:uncharacterized protein LOC126876895 n=1 Tax=Bombus huntii TaxID=85661 RepID=UPI0021AA1924|nr:uncharacterized protein LOC126876895 [Bombus huntii]
MVRVGSQMKYLGLTIDSQWTFEPHFDSLIPKVSAAANALCGLPPNIGGAGDAVRRLYEGVVRSRVMYGAPVWADDLMASRRSILLLRRLHRMTAIRIIRGYRTVSHASASTLAAPPPPPVGAAGAGAQKEIHPPERMAPGRRPHRAGGSKRHRNRRGGHMEPVAIPTDQREKRTPRRGCGPTKLGGME